MDIDRFYTFDENAVRNAFKKHRPHKVLIQLPEGIKHFYPSILGRIRNLANYEGLEFHLDASPTYGSCMMDVSLSSQYDLVLHFGHVKYPYWTPPKNVVLVDLKSKAELSSETLLKLFEYLKNNGLKRIAVYTTAQHDPYRVADFLTSRGIEVVNNLKRSVVFGCWYSDLKDIENTVDAIVVISGGEFHSLGAGLLTEGKKVVISLDPYTDGLSVMNKRINRLLKVRLFKVLKATKAKSWVIIGGTAGQFRPNLINYIKKLLEKANCEYYIARTAYVTQDLIGNLDSNKVDAFSITSCPRLAIDDLAEYQKPVLTPGETEMAITGNLKRYVFPW